MHLCLQVFTSFAFRCGGMWDRAYVCCHMQLLGLEAGSYMPTQSVHPLLRMRCPQRTGTVCGHPMYRGREWVGACGVGVTHRHSTSATSLCGHLAYVGLCLQVHVHRVLPHVHACTCMGLAHPSSCPYAMLCLMGSLHQVFASMI